MKKTTILAIFLFSTLISFGQRKEKIKGDREVVTVSKTILNIFKTIEIDDNLEVNINQGSRNSYLLTTDKNLVSSIQFSVIDSILKIYTLRNIVSNKKLEIDLTVSELEYIVLKNDASIKSNNKLEVNTLKINGDNICKFDLDIEGTELFITMQGNNDGKIKFKGENATIIMNDRTDLDADLRTTNLEVTLNDNAQLRAEGNSDNATYNLKKGSDLKAKKLECGIIKLNASSNSDVYVRASKNLEVYAQGKSEIYVYGNPEIDVKELSDKSKIIKK